MSFKMTRSDFDMLAKYMDRQAKGSDLTFTLDAHGGSVNIKVSDNNSDIANITLYAEGSNITPKIAVTRGLGDEIK